MRKITLDIETTGAAGGMFDPSALELALIGIHDSESDSYFSYTVPELPNLWPLLERADILIGYNSDHFDIPILNKYYSGDLTRIHSIDLLSEIRNVLGRRIKLDSVAKATLGTRKSGSGLDAVRWWAEGKIEKVRKYCLNDVKITKDIYEFAKQHGKVRYDDFGTKRDVPLDTSSWEREIRNAITHTLPF